MQKSKPKKMDILNDINSTEASAEQKAEKQKKPLIQKAFKVFRIVTITLDILKYFAIIKILFFI